MDWLCSDCRYFTAGWEVDGETNYRWCKEYLCSCQARLLQGESSHPVIPWRVEECEHKEAAWR